MRFRISVRFLTAVLAAAFCAQGAHAFYQTEGWPEELGVRTDASYSATRVMRSSHGTMTFKEYKAPGKLYMEYTQEGMRGGTILREDLDRAYVLMFPLGMYQEVSLSEAMARSGNANQDVADISREGRETVNGVECDKFRATFQDENGSGEGLLWVSDEGVVIRMDMTYQTGDVGDRLVMDIKDLVMGPQDAGRFELPPNLKPMNFGGMQIPGMTGGDAPSDADMDEIQKALQELQKRMQQN